VSSTEIEVAGATPTPAVAAGADLELEAHAVEHELLRACVRYSLIALPICIVIWLAIVSIGLALAGSGNFVVALPMAGGVGILAGLFFGVWAAFLAEAERIEDLERRSAEAAR